MSNENKDENIDSVVAEYLTEKNTAKDYGLIGSFFQKNFGFIKKIATSNEPILISGDTGVGKDVLARAIHLLSPRNQENFGVVNLFATTDSLLESELFGHKKGAFTGATKDRGGIVKASEGGTLFLDEIGDIPLGFQAKILRMVELGEIQPLGSDKTENVDIRIIAATNQNLEKMVAQRKFREDLFYRLNIFNFRIPPLKDKDREDDIYDLILHFTDEYLGNNANAVKPFGSELSYAFAKFSSLPLSGNVRELRAYVIRWLTLQGIKTIDQIIGQANGFQQPKPSAEINFEENQETKPKQPFEDSEDLDSMKLGMERLNKDIKELEKRMVNLAVEETRLANGRVNFKAAAELIGKSDKFVSNRFEKK